MVDVAIVGAGQTPYGTHPAAMKDMWADAVRACFDTIDGDLAPSSVDEVFLGSTAFGGGQPVSYTHLTLPTICSV